MCAFHRENKSVPDHARIATLNPEIHAAFPGACMRRGNMARKLVREPINRLDPVTCSPLISPLAKTANR